MEIRLLQSLFSVTVSAFVTAFRQGCRCGQGCIYCNQSYSPWSSLGLTGHRSTGSDAQAQNPPLAPPLLMQLLWRQ